ncbi:unnamed protein product [Anisakis simplex]|uniref:Phosphatidylethanolamine-binding protein 4 (inferred by orthology to a human protein) n=1 Tax=Anisakis simplex TaxID=6269 RepID=A0A0M3IZ02_ANISI|nr:unnamed protein product [Anisakis simplex]
MASDLAAKFAESEITPNVIPNPPAQMLNCNWDGIQVQPGQTMSTRNLRFAPRVTLKVDPESTFTLIMIADCIIITLSDPDNLSRKNPSVAEWLHWLVSGCVLLLFLIHMWLFLKANTTR